MHNGFNEGPTWIIPSYSGNFLSHFSQLLRIGVTFGGGLSFNGHQNVTWDSGGGANSAPCAPFQEDIVQASSAAVSGSIHIWTIDISEGISEFESKPQIFSKSQNGDGSFLKWWYPQTIHFNRGFHYKPSILEYPYFLETPRWTWLRQKLCFF